MSELADGTAGNSASEEREVDVQAKRLAGRPKAARGTGTGLRIYKPGQGYYTRVCTAIGGGVLAVWGAIFVLDELRAYLDPNEPYFYPTQYAIAVGFLAVLCGLLYWGVGIGRKSNDFFIATEGEMKKVSWSSRQEVIRSTKVVIVTVVLLGVFLFVADILFMEFFSTIKVLKTQSLLEKLLGS